MPDGHLDLTVLGCATPYPAADNPSRKASA